MSLLCTIQRSPCPLSILQAPPRASQLAQGGSLRAGSAEAPPVRVPGPARGWLELPGLRCPIPVRPGRMQGAEELRDALWLQPGLQRQVSGLPRPRNCVGGP